MKSLFLKINRGVLLSVAVIVGVVIYYLIMATKTAPVKKEAAGPVKEVFAIYQQTVMVPDEYKKSGITEEKLQPYFDEAQKKLEPYFTSKQAAKDFVDQNIKNPVIYQTVTPTFKYNSVELKYKKIKNISLSNKDQTAEVTVATNYSENISNFDIIVNDDGTIKSTQNAGGAQSQYNMDYQLVLTKTNGKWLISKFITPMSFSNYQVGNGVNKYVG